jgi:hypothetical protein
MDENKPSGICLFLFVAFTSWAAFDIFVWPPLESRLRTAYGLPINYRRLLVGKTILAVLAASLLMLAANRLLGWE